MASIIPNRTIIKISGEDSFKFLQNLVTNDLSLCTESNAIYAMMISPQGRFLFDMFIVKTGNSYLLDIFMGTKDLLLQKMKMYKINLKVEIEDISEQYRVGYSKDITSDVICYKDPRCEKMGYRSIVAFELSADDNFLYLHDKYEYAIPDGGVDLLYDKAMPQEYGAEEMNAISYTKGCYIGQEVISRTKYQGQVRKKIYKLSSESDLSEIPHGSEITSENKKIGIFCSGYKAQGIALIRIEDLEASSGECFVGDILLEVI